MDDLFGCGLCSDCGFKIIRENFWIGNRIQLLFQLAFLFPQAGFAPGLRLYPVSCCCLLYTSPSPRDQRGSRMPSSA